MIEEGKPSAQKTDVCLIKESIELHLTTKDGVDQSLEESKESTEDLSVKLDNRTRYFSLHSFAEIEASIV